MSDAEERAINRLMRHALLPVGVLAATLCGAPAHAQTADPTSPPPTHVKPKPKPRAAKPVTPAAHPVIPPQAPPPSPPPVPIAPPPAPTLPPPLVVPIRPIPPPIPAAVVAEAAGEATAEADGLRVTFGPGSSDLNPKTDAAIRELVRRAPPFAGVTFSIVAVAPGTEEDPSTPRRLSLSRALAVRSVLITEGIASSRIYVKAMGANPQALSGGPPDRADITTSGASPTSGADPAAPKPGSNQGPSP